MFEQLDLLPADPLLGIIAKYRSDENPNKIDLGVGVYKDEQGLSQVMGAVKQAESEILLQEDTKDYVGPFGNMAYGELMAKLVLGDLAEKVSSRLAHIQTPGGCGALRLLAELIKQASPAKVWVSDPTWANHVPLIGGAGVQLETYPYYDFGHGGLRFDAMCSALEEAARGDVVLLHGCCHNPSGADLGEEQWRVVIDLCERKGLVPLIDIAYQGLGDSLDADAYGLRYAVEHLPEVLVSVSCSKNFALYRERVGSAFVLCNSPSAKQAANTHLASIARGIYSMPPSHGSMVVSTILSSSELRSQWQMELAEMRDRLQSVRQRLATSLSTRLNTDRFNYIADDKGLFSFLGISESQVTQLAEQSSIYMAGSSRINLAGFNDDNIGYFVDAFAELI
jgi:aspartate aminotransferase